MKYLVLVWAGLRRKPMRTALTMLSIVAVSFLFGVLQGMKTGVDQAIADARADLLLVRSRVGSGDRLPLAHLEKIKTLPGVKSVSIMDSFAGTYQKPTQQIGVVASNPEKDWPTVYPNFVMAPQTLASFMRTRTGAIVVEDLATKYGWKVGDRIPIDSTIMQKNGSTNWAFDIVGTFKYDAVDTLNNYIVVHYSYLDEARLNNQGTVARFNVVASDPLRAAAVADEIDQRFANSSNETRTDSLREQAQAQLQAIGDLDFVIRSILGAALIALLFSTSTMMMNTLRERTPEFAILKALGYSDKAVSLLLLVEAIVVFASGTIVGIALAICAFPFAARMLPALSMPFAIVPTALLLSVAAALITVALPAARTARLQIVDGLAGRC